MAPRAKITDTISIEEMLNMREKDRLINSEIARRLEVSPLTINKYIGPTPKDMLKEFQIKNGQKTKGRKRVKNGMKSQSPECKVKYTPPYSAKDWQESTTIHKLNGFYANYEVNSTTSETEITFIDGHSLGKLNKADLMKLIDEFSRVASILER